MMVMIPNDAPCRILRQGEPIFEGTFSQLKKSARRLRLRVGDLFEGEDERLLVQNFAPLARHVHLPRSELWKAAAFMIVCVACVPLMDYIDAGTHFVLALLCGAAEIAREAGISWRAEKRRR